MHPLVDDLHNLKDSELESKINDLTRKYFMAMNPDVQFQIASVLESYKEEQAIRQKAAYDKMMNQQGKGLDKLINVN